MKLKNILQIVIGSVLLLLLAFVSWEVFMKPIKGEALTAEEAGKVVTDRFNGEVMDTNLENDIYEIALELDTGEYHIQVSRDSGEVLAVERTKEETPEKELAEDDIKKIIEKKELGEVEDIHKKQDDQITSYEAIVKSDHQKIYLTLDGESGEIMKQEEEELQESEEKDAANSSDSEENSESNAQSESESGSDEQEETESKESQNLTTEEAVQIALDTVYGEVDDIDLEDEDGQMYYFIEIETDDDLEAEIQIHAITGEVISIEWDD